MSQRTLSSCRLRAWMTIVALAVACCFGRCTPNCHVHQPVAIYDIALAIIRRLASSLRLCCFLHSSSHLGLIAKTPAEGAATQCYVATHPSVAGVTGKYFADCNPMKILQPNHLFNEQMAAQLWQESLRMTNGFV